MHTCHNIVQKQRQCIVGAQETHSFRGIVVKKAKTHSFFYLPVSNLNNLAKNVREAYEPTIPEISDLSVFSILRYSAIYD